MLAFFILLEGSNLLIVIFAGEAEHMPTSCVGQARSLKFEGMKV